MTSETETRSSSPGKPTSNTPFNESTPKIQPQHSHETLTSTSDIMNTQQQPKTESSGTNASTTTTKSKSKDKKSLRRLKDHLKQHLKRNLVPILIFLPYFLGLLWTSLHPLISIITGELKCRGQYIDENGLDVHRHRVENYPLERHLAYLARDVTETPTIPAIGGMCGTIHSLTQSAIISPSIECLRHAATTDATFDIVKIQPATGPMIESTEAVVIVVGETSFSSMESSSSSNVSRSNGDVCSNEIFDKAKSWYETSDLNASIMHLIQRLGNAEECPWLSKTVFIVSPTPYHGDGAQCSSSYRGPSLKTVADAFLASYLGPSSSTFSSFSQPIIRPLPPSFTYPQIRSLLLLNNLATPSFSLSNHQTKVRILPQGLGGTLPNLDLVFATFLSFKSYAKGENGPRGNSIYYGNSDFKVHGSLGGGEWLEDTLKHLIEQYGFGVGKWIENLLGIKNASVRLGMNQYALDLAGWMGFVASLAFGHPQPHATALIHGIDALTIELHIPMPPATVDQAQSIHPHHADTVRCIEHLLRSISNLHERLHHSIAQYTMPSPSKFVSHGEYIYPAILVTLPLVVRAASLALRDLNRFQFGFVGVVVGSVFVASLVIDLFVLAWTRDSLGSKEREGAMLEQSLLFVYFLGYCLVVGVARWSLCFFYERQSTCKAISDKVTLGPVETVGTTGCGLQEESRSSLRFIGCLIGIYFHAPLLLANYSLGLPSSIFWTPLLAMLMSFQSTPSSSVDSKKKGTRGKMRAVAQLVVMGVTMQTKLLVLVLTSPPVFLVPYIFHWYSPYVLIVYTPLHLILAAIWLA